MLAQIVATVLVFILSLVNSVQIRKLNANTAMEVINSDIVNIHGKRECDLIFLPLDDQQFCHKCDSENSRDVMDLIQEGRAFTRTSAVASEDLENGHCPFIILPTENTNRLQDIMSLVASVQLPVSVIVITESLEVEELFSNATVKSNFDAYMITYREETQSYMLTKALVAEDEAWNSVNVAYRPMPYGIQPLGKGRFKGLDWEILVEATRRAGIMFQFHFAKTYTSMINKVGTDSVDMAISYSSFSHERYRAAGDISTQYGRFDAFLVTRKPQAMPAAWALIYPFDIYSWIWVIVSIVAVVASFVLLNIVMFFQMEYQVEPLHIFAIACSAILIEAVPPKWLDIRLHSKTGLILLFVWFPTGLFISMAYRSTLLASLISVELEDPITTWQQMLDHKMILQIHKGVVLNNVMKESDIPIVRQVYQECVIKRKGLYTGKRTEKMKQDRVDNKAARLGSANKYNFRYMQGVKLASTPQGFHYARKFPWKETIDKIMQDFVDMGLTNRHKDSLDFKYAKAERDAIRNHREETTKKLNLTHLQLTWWFLVGALIVCTVAFVWEGCHCRLVAAAYREMTTDK